MSEDKDPQGIGGASNSLLSATRLELVSTNTITLTDDLSVEFSKTNGVSNNYIEFDCNGYKSISLEGKFKFSEGLLIPAVVPTTGSGDVEPPAVPVPPVGGAVANAVDKPKVTATLRIVASDLNNVLITTSITPFRVKNLKDFIFEVQEASIDMSDLANPSGFAYPVGYTGGYSAADALLWQGFHLKLLKITFLGMKSTATKPPVYITAADVLIDDSGVSGLFEATNLLNLADGSAAGWAASIDHLHLKLVQNTLMGAGMEGKLKVPFLGEDPVSYEASITRTTADVNYSFGIKLDSALAFNMPVGLVAKMRSGSSIVLTRVNGVTIARADLTGIVSSSQPNAKFGGIAFQNMIITSQAPYLVGGTFSLVSTTAPKCRDFGISLTELGLYSVNPTQSKFTVRAGINFTDAGSVSVGAAATIDFFVNTMTMTEGGLARRKWELDRITVNNIAISCHTNAFRLDGIIAIYENDPVYGNGFKGGITLGINAYDFGATIYFGTRAISTTNSNTFRYFGVVAFGKGFNLPCPAPFYITGIMGGFAYKMANGNYNPDFSEINAPGAAVSGIGYESGTISAAINFIPDPTMGILFRAGISFKVGAMSAEESPTTGDATLEIAFNAGGGLSYIRFQGAVYFMNDATSTQARSKGTTADTSQKNYGTLAIVYDHTNRCFHAVIEGYLNLSVIRGSGTNGRLGQVVIHIDPNNWYVYLGKSSSMLGATIYGLTTVNAYFMIGTVIEGMPLLPVAVRNALGIPVADQRSGSDLQYGSGFAFGVHLGAGFNGEAGPFFASFNVLAGLDVMILNLPSNIGCAGRPGRPGIDGWFAQGQIYVYVAGAIGIKARGKKINIASVTLAAACLFKGPNPTWLMGRVNGSYSVLCGLVSGSFSFKFEVGEKCVLVSNTGSEVTIKVIENMKPDANATAVSVFALVQASLNVPAETSFRMADVNDVEGDYRVFVSEFTCKNQGVAVVGTLSWNSTKKVYSFRSRDILPPNATLNLKIVARWEKLQGSTWVTLNRTDGTPETEMLQSTFTTGPAPQDIYGNVANAYPIKNQYNFYKDETTSNFVNLNVGQPYLFQTTDPDGKSWRFETRFKDISSPTAPLITTALTYNASTMKITIGVANNLVSNKIYKMTLVKIPVGGTVSGSNVQTTTVTSVVADAGTTVVASSQLQNTLISGEKAIYEIHFRTSTYPTFAAKIAAYGSGNDYDFIAGNNAFFLYKEYLNISETLDDFEIDAHPEDAGAIVPALVSLQALPNTWLTTHHQPRIYDTYPQAFNITMARNPTNLGLIPLKAVNLDRGTASPYMLDAQNISIGTASPRIGSVRLIYLVPFYVRLDADDLQVKAVANYLNGGGGAAVQNLITYVYTQITPRSNYGINVSYTLPDGTITSIVPINIFAP